MYSQTHNRCPARNNFMFLSSIDFIVKKSPDFFLAGLSVSFVSSLFLEALTSLPKRVRRYFKSNYSYSNAVKKKTLFRG